MGLEDRGDIGGERAPFLFDLFLSVYNVRSFCPSKCIDADAHAKYAMIILKSIVGGKAPIRPFQSLEYEVLDLSYQVLQEKLSCTELS